MRGEARQGARHWSGSTVRNFQEPGGGIMASMLRCGTSPESGVRICLASVNSSVSILAAVSCRNFAKRIPVSATPQDGGSIWNASRVWSTNSAERVIGVLLERAAYTLNRNNFKWQIIAQGRHGSFFPRSRSEINTLPRPGVRICTRLRLPFRCASDGFSLLSGIGIFRDHFQPPSAVLIRSLMLTLVFAIPPNPRFLGAQPSILGTNLGQAF